MSKQDELLPCPFCGGKAYFVRTGTARRSCIVTCEDCGARQESSDEYENSGNSWNTRPTPSDEKKRLEEVALNVKHRDCHKAADAFWQYWRENGVPHKHGYYESTWGAINQALRYAGIVPHEYRNPRIEVTGTTRLGDCIAMTPAALSHKEEAE